MSPDMLILAALCLPLLIAIGIAAAGRFPNVREGVTVVGSVLLLGVVIALAMAVSRGETPYLDLGSAAPGLSFTFKLEPLGALFALVASGLWIVNSFYSIGYMRGNRERNQTRFYICFAVAIFGALLLLFAFGIGKAALMPVHFWLPNAMVAPTPVSALLHAVAVVKAGVFTVMKVSIFIFGEELLNATPGREFILGVACFTIIVASLVAMTKDNLKARLAYSTIAQLAYVTAGAMLANQAGFLGGSIQIAAHAAGKMTLFMCAGAIYVATGVTTISQMRGLGRRMPMVFIAFFIASLSIIGIPPMAGSWAKYELMQGAIDGGHSYVPWVLIGSSLLNIAYLLPIPILALMPPPGSPEPRPFKRPGGAPALTVAAPVFTAALCIILFFLIGPLADFLAPSVGSSAAAIATGVQP